MNRTDFDGTRYRGTRRRDRSTQAGSVEQEEGGQAGMDRWAGEQQRVNCTFPYLSNSEDRGHGIPPRVPSKPLWINAPKPF